MKFFPVEKRTFQSPLTEEQIRTRLAKYVELKISYKREMIPSYISKPYTGLLGIRDFEIRRIIFYRNSFLPVIKGSYNDNALGCIIKVKMTLQTSNYIFSVVWCGFVVFAAIGLLFHAFSGAGFKGNDIIPFLMLIFFYLMMIFSFKYESKKSIKHLEEWFEIKAIYA